MKDRLDKKKKRPVFRLKDAMKLSCDNYIKSIRNPSRPGYKGKNVVETIKVGKAPLV